MSHVVEKSDVASSVAQSTASQLNIKQEANETKAKLRTLLKNIDAEKCGKIKSQLLWQMLALHKIVLSAKDQSFLLKNFGNGDQIRYKDAI